MLASGSVLGNLRIVKRLGSGGMGEVFLAENPQGSRCAVKVLDPDVADSESVERFRLEAEFAKNVRHPNLVEVYGVARDEGTGLSYLAMEYMSGGSLRDMLNANPGGLSVASVMSVARNIARALVLIEENGMVHRDIKPDNVLFASDGIAKLADLGISRFSGKTGDDVRATRANAVIGTPAYMAPEQMLDSHSVDIRADIYSFGLMLHEMLAGRRPNDGQDALRTLAKAIEGMPFPDVRASRPDTPAGLAALVAEMTLPDPDRRPASAGAVLDRLEGVACARRLRARARAAVPWHRDRHVLYAATGMVLALEALVFAIARVMRGS